MTYHQINVANFYFDDDLFKDLMSFSYISNYYFLKILSDIIHINTENNKI